MALSACFTDVDVFLIHIANLADRRFRADEDHSDFAGGESHLSVSALFCHQLCGIACASYELRAFAGFYFHIVDHRADRDCRERQCVAGLDVRLCAGNNRVSHFEADRSDDVSLLSVNVMEQRDVCASVWIVFDGCNLSRHAVFVAFEIDDPVFSLLAPPPTCLTVILPCTFLPPDFLSETSSDFSGVVDVISSKAETDMNLLPGEVGLYFLIAINK